jgi:hypothetical protein
MYGYFGNARMTRNDQMERSGFTVGWMGTIARNGC